MCRADCILSAYLSVWEGRFDLSCRWPPAARGLGIGWTISVNMECLLFCLRVTPLNIFWCVTCLCHMKNVVSTSLQKNGPKTNWTRINFHFSFCCLVVVCNTELMKGPSMSPNVVFYAQVSKSIRLFALSHHFIYQPIPPHTLITCSKIAHHHTYYNVIIYIRLNSKVWIFFGVTSL